MCLLDGCLGLFQGALCPNPFGDVDGVPKNQGGAFQPVISNIPAKPDAVAAISCNYAHGTAASRLAPDAAQVLIEEMANGGRKKLPQVPPNAVLRIVPILRVISKCLSGSGIDKKQDAVQVMDAHQSKTVLHQEAVQFQLLGRRLNGTANRA